MENSLEHELLDLFGFERLEFFESSELVELLEDVEDEEPEELLPELSDELDLEYFFLAGDRSFLLKDFLLDEPDDLISL